MDGFHQRLARLALGVGAGYGFCLAGGYAVQAHGFVDRVSKDVDLFTDTAATANFPRLKRMLYIRLIAWAEEIETTAAG